MEGGPKNTNKSDSEQPNDEIWTELEEIDPEFQELLVVTLQNKLLYKKFGEKFFDEYEKKSIQKALEQSGKTIEKLKTLSNDDLLEAVEEAYDAETENPVIPEVGDFIKKVRSVKTVKEMITFAIAKGLAFSAEEIASAKETAIDAMGI